MKNQLFRISPDLKITEELLKLFGIKDINDNHSFTRKNLLDLKTVEKMNEIIDELIDIISHVNQKNILMILMKRNVLLF